MVANKKTRYLRTVEEKLQTKINKVALEPGVTTRGKNIFYKDKLIFSYTVSKIKYGTVRVSTTKIEPFYEAEYAVTFLLSQESLSLLNSNILNPPFGVRVIGDIFRARGFSVSEIIVGSEENRKDGAKVFITVELYKTLISINKEEGADKQTRVANRTLPFLKGDFQLNNLEESITHRDYHLLFKEIISSGQVTSSDVVAIAGVLEPGNDSQVVISQQMNQQTEWLLSILRIIIDEPKLNKIKARSFGNKYFGYPSGEITGPEHLMEKILSDYGKNIIFGAPALLNTDKYVVSTRYPRVQFDLILIDALSDVEIVELKKPDTLLLDYDADRRKFYPSKELSIAIGQSERYISTISKDNDENFKIKGKKIKEYIESQVDGSIELSITRPSALIVIGRIQDLAADYDKLKADKKSTLTRKQYEDNLKQAYREIKKTHKNIRITTYTELVEGAELRLKTM